MAGTGKSLHPDDILWMNEEIPMGGSGFHDSLREVVAAAFIRVCQRRRAWCSVDLFELNEALQYTGLGGFELYRETIVGMVKDGLIKQSDYGSPKDEFWVTAKLLEILIKSECPLGGQPYDVPEMLARLKNTTELYL